MTFETKLQNNWNDDIVVVCIGSSKVIGDSVGPRVGSILLHDDRFTRPVYGTMENPVQSFNLKSIVDFINMKHPKSTILAIDSTISDKYREGSIYFNTESLSPGKGISKDLDKVGDMCIKAVVLQVEDFSETNKNELVKDLYKVSEEFIDRLVRRIASAIINTSSRDLNNLDWVSGIVKKCNQKGLRIININFQTKTVKVQRGKVIKEIKV
ncbi:hypothetical protein UT300012_21410 [Paraclostridium bifermentans]